MSIRLPVTASDDEIRQVVLRWSELLAEERYSEALAMFETSDRADHHPWTIDLLARTIAFYGDLEHFPGTPLYHVTSVHGRNDLLRAIRIDVDRANLYALAPERYLGMVHYEHVPLNGTPSDLTARFDIRRLGENELTLDFCDLLVM